MARAGYLRQLGDVVSHAVALAVRRRFAREPDLRYLTRYVALVLAAFDALGLYDREVHQLLVEAERAGGSGLHDS